jgi:hypothetical protein
MTNTSGRYGAAGSLALAAAMLVPIVALPAAGRNTGPDVATLVRSLTRETPWRLVRSTPVGFATHHPQGMARVGDTLFVSSVEVKVRTTRFPAPVDGHDRDTGEGVGHLFRMDLNGTLLGRVALGRGSIYHPGGVDYDGRHLWVAVAEYRPDSRSIVYRVDARTMTPVEVLRVPDHLGAVVHDTEARMLVGVSWGSRRFYRWAMTAEGMVANADAPLESVRTPNPSHYVDYQDCKYAGGRRMLCTGVSEIRRRDGSTSFRLGGLDLVDTSDLRPVHQVPVLLWAAGGLPMTQNPVWIEALPGSGGLRAYFMPEDDRSTLYVYEAELP